VVEAGSAVRVVDNSTIVELEGESICLNGNSDWAKSESGLELRWAIGSDIFVVGDLGNNFGGIESAASVNTFIGVIGVGFLSTDSLDVIVGLVHPATVASCVSVAC